MRQKQLVSGVVLSALAFAGAVANAATLDLYKYNVVVTNNMVAKSHVNGQSVVKNLNAVQLSEFGQRPNQYNGDSLLIAGTAQGEFKIFEGTLHHDQAFAANSPTVHKLNSSQYNHATTDTVASTMLNKLSSQMAQQSAGFAVLPSQGGQTTGGQQVNSDYRFDASAGYTGQVVFNVTLAMLQSKQFAFNLRSASSIVINVVGDGTLSGNKFTSNPGNRDGVASKLLWNFTGNVNINITDEWWGTILATNGSVSHTSNIDGGVYVKNLTQGAEIHDYLFTGTPIPEPQPGPLPVPLPLSATAGMGLLAMGALGRRR